MAGGAGWGSRQCLTGAWCDTRLFVWLLYLEKVIQPGILLSVPYSGVRRW